MNDCYRLKMADIEFNYKFYYADTYKYFVDYIIKRSVGSYDLKTTDEDFDRWKSLIPSSDTVSYLEQRMMILKLSQYLCRKNACVFHACAVIWKGYAWLFTAPSGTGKTTMYLNWKRQLGKDIQILNGDMPLVLAHPHEEVMVYPSPWNGKENYGSLIHAPLGGIIYLEQDKENDMTRMKISDMVLPLYTQFMCISDSEMTVKCISHIEERILKTVPLWHFKNKGDLSSAKVSCDVIYDYLQEKGHWKNID